MVAFSSIPFNSNSPLALVAVATLVPFTVTVALTGSPFSFTTRPFTSIGGGGILSGGLLSGSATTTGLITITPPSIV